MICKTMARLHDGAVANLEWWSADTSETDTLKDHGDRPVTIGDTYEGGKWYRDGVEILTPLEEAQKRIAELEAQNSDMSTALEILEVSAE